MPKDKQKKQKKDQKENSLTQKSPNRGIIIGGGVGPMAGVMLHSKIIQQTPGDGTDQGHLDIVHLSFSGLIPDRTAYLLGKVETNPAFPMADIVCSGLRCLADRNKSGVVGIPCNTFHAPAIFLPFTDIIRKTFPEAVIINMIEETLKALQPYKKIGLLSTTGTRKANIWPAALEKEGHEVLQISTTEQDLLHEAIYDPRWGLKAVLPPTDKAVERVLNFSTRLLEQGAEIIILGCTELPLAPGEKRHRANQTANHTANQPETGTEAAKQGSTKETGIIAKKRKLINKAVINESTFIDPMDLLAKALIEQAVFEQAPEVEQGP